MNVDHVAALEWAKQHPHNSLPDNNLAAAYLELTEKHERLRRLVLACLDPVTDFDTSRSYVKALRAALGEE